MPLRSRTWQILAEGAGLHETAAAYRKRLEALGLAQTALPSRRADHSTPHLASGQRNCRPTLAVPATGNPCPEARGPHGAEANALRELLRDLSHVTVERRGGRLTLIGWTSSPKEKEMLGKIIAGRSDVLDLTTDDVGDIQAYDRGRRGSFSS